MISFKVTIYAIEDRKGQKKTTYRVRWVVAANRFGEAFRTKQLAEAYRALLITAARNGEGFDTETGLPVSMERERRDVSFYQHALDYTASAWPAVAAKTRVSIIEALSRVVPVVVRDIAGAPSPDVLRRALRKQLNQGSHAGELDPDESKAIGWIAKASRPVSAFDDTSVVCDVLDALAVNLDGKPSAPMYFSRRRRVLHRALGYAVRKKRLAANPLSKGNLPDDWTPPQAPDDTVDPRAVGSPALIAKMLDSCNEVGRRQGPRFTAFYGCMFYALMRPSEVAALTRDACHLPEDGWGYLIFADASPAAGKAYTDDGQVHEHRGLKGRTKGRTDPASPQARPESPNPTRARRAPPRPPPAIRRGSGRAAVPLGERQPGPAVHLVAALAEGPGRVSYPRAARLAAAEAPLRPAPLRRHLAAQLRRPACRDRRVGRAFGGDADADLRPLRDRDGRRVDRPHGQDAPAGGGPVNSGTYRGQNPSQDDIQRHRLSEAVNRVSRVPAGRQGVSAYSGGRPQQDSNLRTRLRRARSFRSMTSSNEANLGFLGRHGRVEPVWRPRSGRNSGKAVSAFESRWLVLRVDAVLTEQGVEPLDFVGELLISLGQYRQRRMGISPLLLTRGLAGQQFPLPLKQQSCLLVVAGNGGAMPLETDPVDLVVQVIGVRPSAYLLLNGHESLFDRLQATLHRWQEPELSWGRSGRHGPASLVSVHQLNDQLPGPDQIGAQPHKHLSGYAVAFPNEAEQYVLGADVILAELLRLAQRKLEDLLGRRRERYVPRWRQFLALADDLLDLLPDCGQADPQRLQRLGRYSVVLVNKAEQYVLGTDVVVMEHPGFLLRQDHHAPSRVGKPLEHRPSPRVTEPELAASSHDRPNGSCPSTPVIIHPQYGPGAKAKSRRDRGVVRLCGRSWSVRMLAANRSVSSASKSVCTDASRDDRGGSSAHRKPEAARHGR